MEKDGQPVSNSILRQAFELVMKRLDEIEAKLK
jgi:tetrahydromethanopterin S-methyltransferase subunit G